MIYVVGFLFSDDYRWVTLIKKSRPEWQAGKFNGVGGKVETGEAVQDAMVREFQEETGVKTKWTDWKEFALLSSGSTSVYCFRAVSTKYVSFVKTTTDEMIMNILVKHILDSDAPYETVPNLPVLVRLAMTENVKYATLEY